MSSALGYYNVKPFWIIGTTFGREVEKENTKFKI